MKKLLFILMLLPLYTLAQNCPPKGDSKEQKIIDADLLKNRSSCPDKSTAKKYDMALFMKDKINDNGLVYVEGYINEVKKSGTESCECHIKDESFLDYHIYVSGTLTSNKALNQIVEVTRYSRAKNPQLDYNYVKSLVGKKVRIYGYTFMDAEHKGGVGNWRSGIEEIHPVFYIDKL